MLLENLVNDLLNQKFSEENFRDCFVVEVEFSNNRLTAFLDSDHGLSLDRCAEISKWLGNYIEEHALIDHAYTLEVSSFGLDKPLRLGRQYLKNIGRPIKIHLENQKILEGTLAEVKEDLVVVAQEIIEIENKKKVKKLVHTIIPQSEIEKTFIQIKF